jgi:hypothetical protein
MNKRRLSNLLIGLGVLVWLPYFTLLILDQHPPLFPFLGGHLAGVLTGVWFRRKANQEDGLEQDTGRSKRVWIANGLSLVGILAWAPYLYLKYAQGMVVDMAPFLAVHLIGLLGGGIMRISLEIRKRNKAT